MLSYVPRLSLMNNVEFNIFDKFSLLCHFNSVFYHVFKYYNCITIIICKTTEVFFKT